MKTKLYIFLKCALVLTVMLLANQIMAQDRKLTGKIIDTNNQPIPGTNVSVKGTTNGTISDANGNFSLTVKSDNDVIVVSTIGYKPQTFVVGTQSTLNVTMEEDISTLGEVLVMGYTSENRRETTGSVTTVKAKDLLSRPSGNVEQLLQGVAPGVTVITNGQPGTASIIRVRGFGSFGGNTPLYIVDGLPVFSIDFLSPNDIESTTVLKDAAAASNLWGKSSCRCDYNCN